MIGRTFAIARKELLHIIRDRRILAVIFLLPVMQLFLLGYAVTTDVWHIRTAVLDWDRTADSRQLVQAGRQAPVAVAIDGSDPNVANTVLSAAQQVGQAHGFSILRRRHFLTTDTLSPIDLRPHVWYNPLMKSVSFMIPGLMGMVLALWTSLLTALASVREREAGTVGTLMVTPIRPAELVLGKVIPYIAVAYFNVLEVLAIGILWFGVPLRGSLALLLGISAVFVLSSLGIGFFISSISKTQQEAMLLVSFTLLPSVFLAGFLFPIEAMPWSLQMLSHIIPLRYMLEILRGIILKGVGMEVLSGQVWALMVFGMTIITLASRRFRKQLD